MPGVWRGEGRALCACQCGMKGDLCSCVLMVRRISFRLQVNKVALGRMVGLYEQHIGDGMGSKYLEECWDPQSGNQAHFLISPLTEELRALTVAVAPASPRFPPHQPPPDTRHRSQCSFSHP
jgi:hypothetical protein